jgi:diguanylate cyclase (GGDEF)-like protein
MTAQSVARTGKECTAFDAANLPTSPKDRLADIETLITKHRHTICGLLSAALGIVSIAEPVTVHIRQSHAWLAAAIGLAIACFANAALTLGRNARLATHLLVAMVAGFVVLQVDMRTGMAWAFIVPPLILFMHPPRRGFAYVVGVAGVLLIACFSLHDTRDLHRADNIDFICSFAVVTTVSTLFSRDLLATTAAVTAIAFRDPLTGLLQRDIFESLANAQMKRATFGETALCVAIVDIDNMKHINDEWGHAAGDFAIQHVSRALTSALREADLCSRIGGDEFMVLFNGATAEQARHIVERVLRCVSSTDSSAPWHSEHRLTVSAGVAQLRGDENFSDLYLLADRALIRAKQKGRNIVAGSN